LTTRFAARRWRASAIWTNSSGRRVPGLTERRFATGTVIPVGGGYLAGGI
jgi:hypothetical protein